MRTGHLEQGVNMAPVAPSRSAVTFVFVTVLLDMVGFGLIIPVLPRLIEDVGHVGLGQAAVIGGWMFLAFSAAQFLFAPIMGSLSDAYGRRPLLLLAVAGLFFDYVFSALAPSIMWLFVGRVIAGVAGSSYVIANAFIADVTAPEDRAKAFGLMGAAFGIGFVIGPAIGGLLGEFGPRVPFWVAAGISALNFAFGWFVLPETLAPGKRRPFALAHANPFGTFKVFRAYPGVLPLVLVLGLFFFASSVYPAIWPYWGIAKFGWSATTIGLTLAAFGLIAAVVQGGLSGPLVKRFGEHRVALTGLIFAVVAAIGYGFAPSLSVVLIMLLVHAPEGLVHPMLTALLSRAAPEDAQGQLQGGIASVTNVAMLLGTLFYAQIFGYFMRPTAPVVSPVISFFVAAGFLAVALWMFARIMRGKGIGIPVAAAPELSMPAAD
jgi:DHA1 family tetracycline resistance protein-like MFS transporter